MLSKKPNESDSASRVDRVLCFLTGKLVLKGSRENPSPIQHRNARIVICQVLLMFGDRKDPLLGAQQLDGDLANLVCKQELLVFQVV